jgi:hypothetical protein
VYIFHVCISEPEFVQPVQADEEVPPQMKTPPRKDLETYYRDKGLTLSHVRRLNRNYIRHDGLPGEAMGLVFWDSYTPPPGYTGRAFNKNC